MGYEYDPKAPFMLNREERADMASLCDALEGNYDCPIMLAIAPELRLVLAQVVRAGLKNLGETK